jgi:phage repressor protein C with HTH and peptisase S24 domain
VLKIIKVTGESLTPVYQEGDFVVIASNPFLFGSIKPGDIVVFVHNDFGTMIKKVQSVDFDQIYVTGTHAHSVDSNQLGPIHRDRLLGKVIWHIAGPSR